MQRASLLAFLLLALAASPAAAQELVLNGSFEDNTSCPSFWSHIWKAVPWYNPTGGSSDYIHTCSTFAQTQAPDTKWGWQFASDGDGYAGGYWYLPADICGGAREYIQAPLLDPLIAGQTYTFRMKVSLADNSFWSIDSIGAFFTVGPYTATGWCTLDLEPTVEGTPGVMWDDMDGWMVFEQSFVAVGGEDHVTIGNFRTDSDTNITLTGAIPPTGMPESAYYFVDEVSLQAVDCVDAPADMISWWPLDEPTGTNSADIEGIHSGFWVGAPDPTEGMVDGCYDFGISYGYVSVSPHPELSVGTNDFSIDAWIRPALIQDSPIVSKVVDADAGGNGYALYITDAGRVGIVLRDVSGTTTYESIDFVELDEWAFVAVTVDRDQPDGLRIYVNDSVTIHDPTLQRGTLFNQEHFFIGHQGVTTAGAPWEGDFEGRIDEVEFFGAAVDEPTMLSIYSARSSGKCKPSITTDPSPTPTGVPISWPVSIPSGTISFPSK